MLKITELDVNGFLKERVIVCDNCRNQFVCWTSVIQTTCPFGHVHTVCLTCREEAKAVCPEARRVAEILMG